MSLNYQPNLELNREAQFPITAGLLDAALALAVCEEDVPQAAQEVDTYSYAPDLKRLQLAAWRAGTGDDVYVRKRNPENAVTLFVTLLYAAWDWSTSECRCGYPRLRLAMTRREYDRVRLMTQLFQPPASDGACASFSVEQLKEFLALLMIQE